MLAVRRVLAVVWLVGIVFSLCSLPCAAQQRVKVQIAFVIDGSGSMNEGGQDLFWPILRGISVSLQDRTLVPRDGSVEVTVVQFGVGPLGVDARVEVPPTVITEDTIYGISSAVQGIQQGGGYTPTAEGIRLATQLMTASSHSGEAEFRVINISTDGVPNNPIRFPEDPYEGALADALAASAEAQAAGIHELDAELLGDDWQSSIGSRFFDQVVFPQPAVWVPPDEIQGGFVRVIERPDDYILAVEDKLYLVLHPSPTPTLTSTNTPVPTITPTATSTFTPAPTATGTRTPSLTPTVALTVTPRPSPTPDPNIPEPGSLALLASGLAALAGGLGWRGLGRRGVRRNRP